MAEQSWSRITIGGKLPVTKIKDLIEALDDDFFDGEGTDGLLEALSANSYRPEPFRYSGMCSWGDPKLTIYFCKKNGLSYVRSYESSPAYGAGVCVYVPGDVDEDETTAADDGEPVLTIERLRRAVKDRDSIHDLIESAQRFDTSSVPPLTVVAEP